MFGDMLQIMTAGKQVEYNGERWILVSNTMMQTTDKQALFVAIRATDTFPAQTYVIPAAPDAHLRSNELR
ncbi:MULTISPECIES: hypothetical protein [Giesbergeria]|uniref:hypothetical protein n=1 Tax=Giesbergeria sinuosa TaxID=80883 RepID=UPI0036D337E1